MIDINLNSVDGDLAVSHDATIGGDVMVNGNSVFKGHVKITGWLEAKKIRAADKGFFESYIELSTTYKEPDNGWWAVVLDKAAESESGIPGYIYVVRDGAWINTKKVAGNITVGDQSYEQLIEDLSNKLYAELAAREEGDAQVEAKVVAEAKARENEDIALKDNIDYIEKKNNEKYIDWGTFGSVEDLNTKLSNLELSDMLLETTICTRYVGNITMNKLPVPFELMIATTGSIFYFYITTPATLDTLNGKEFQYGSIGVGHYKTIRRSNGKGETLVWSSVVSGDIVQEQGDATDKVMSQKAVKDMFVYMTEEEYERLDGNVNADKLYMLYEEDEEEAT